MANQTLREYVPAGPVVKAFHESNAFVRGLKGPFGSSKSTTCVIELLRRAQMQARSSDGIRHTRWAIVRNTFPELRSTTLKTWAEWCPLRFGRFTQDSPIVHHVKVDDIDAEFMFLALDKPEDVRKLLSMELTGAWVNEAREIPKVIIDGITGRLKRFPSAGMGGFTWSGMLMDTNPPDTESWWYKFAEGDTPKGWEFFNQPSGLGPDAENLHWLGQSDRTTRLPLDHPERLAQGKNYYETMLAGKDPDWVKVYVHGEYGFVTEGAAVFPSYRDQTHCAGEVIPVIEGAPLMIGVDFGLTPAAVIGQRLADGRWHIIDEVVMEDIGVIRFAEHLASYLLREYPENSVSGAWGDPAGQARSTHDEKTALEIMNAHTHIKWRPAPSNDLTMRLEVVKATLNRMVDGRPGFQLSTKCRVLRKGFAGGYCRKFIKAGGGAQLHDTPAKNAFSHPHDALQYLLLGGGEHNVVLEKVRRRARPVGPHMAQGVDYPLFG